MMNTRSLGLPFRIGTTSYIVEDDLLANARFLAPSVEDMQLVLFDLPDGASNLPSPVEVAALAAFGAASGFSYTVHLLDDLRLADDNGRTPSLPLRRAHQLLDLTQSLEPWAWVGHLDGRTVRTADAEDPALLTWRDATVKALRLTTAGLQAPHRLAIENLEGYPAEFVTPVVTRAGVGRCVDVGHLWLDGIDPLPALAAAGARMRVVHIHGVNERDHASLAYAPPDALDAVIRTLLEMKFGGVVTLEVFGLEDFQTSRQALMGSVARVQNKERSRS
ncbi:MAG: sugar phosphate isomerase/epimerase [Anaerolineales bacterium]|nr:sugar phosphate isomerase/epimerase [Anaerolineales bacterium]